jgi:undecaprenyl-diphosphatase
MCDLAVLGTPPVLGLVVLLSAGTFPAMGRFRAGLAVLAAVLGGAVAGTFLQTVIDGCRLKAAAATVDWLNGPGVPADYPGGSTLVAAVVYLTLAVVIAPLLPRRPARVFLIGLGGGLAFLCGVGRFYLGRDFVTDTLAGWVGGLAWALACRALLTKSPFWTGNPSGASPQ